LLSSCTKNFEDFNTDQKNPSEVEGEFLFTNAQKVLVDQISSTNVNRNVWKLFAQYWTETTYTDEANYDIINRSIPDNTFDTYYRRILKPLDEAKKLIAEDPLEPTETEAMRDSKIAIAELIEAYSYFNLVTIFGDVPYSEALNIENISPKYDDDVAICIALIEKIDAAYNKLSGDDSFGDADLIYEGDVTSWKKFAMSLKLKIAVVLADANVTGINSADWAQEAVQEGVFASNVDNALLEYQGSSPNTNPLYEDLVASGRNDFVPANTIVDLMDSLTDPRMSSYFDDNLENWVGGVYGASNSYKVCSHINEDIQKPTFYGILLTYDEVEFYIAEAAARGYNVGQTAEEAYNSAIAASFEFWNADGCEEYLLQENVAWATAGDDWRQKIGTQAYLAYYTRGYIGYTTYRRLDFPVMNVAPSAATGGPIPLRFTYPVNEQTLNAVNYSAAAEAIGGDDMMTRLFWDVN
jgi:hypothetical protein